MILPQMSKLLLFFLEYLQKICLPVLDTFARNPTIDRHRINAPRLEKRTKKNSLYKSRKIPLFPYH